MPGDLQQRAVEQPVVDQDGETLFHQGDQLQVRGGEQQPVQLGLGVPGSRGGLAGAQPYLILSVLHATGGSA